MRSSSYLRSPEFSSEIALFDTSSTLSRVSCTISEQECSEVALSAPSKVDYQITWYCLVLVHQRHIHNSEAFRSYIHQFFQCVLGVNTMLNEWNWSTHRILFDLISLAWAARNEALIGGTFVGGKSKLRLKPIKLIRWEYWASLLFEPQTRIYSLILWFLHHHDYPSISDLWATK